jgi:hypothetical protein
MFKHTKATLWLILLATLVVQFALLSSSMPIRDMLSGAHSFYIDNPYHVYQIELGRSLLKHGQLVGFDPFFAAGHLGGVDDNASARMPVLLSFLVPDAVSTGALYSLYIFACALIAPLAIVWMAVLLDWPRTHTAIAAAAGLAFWWIGALHWYHIAGMVSFVCASYLGLPYAAWTWKLCNARNGRTAAAVIGAGVLGGLGMWLHPLFPVVVGILFLGLFVSNKPQVPVQTIVIRGLGVAVIALLVNAPWLLALFGTHDIEGNGLLGQPYQKAVGAMVALKPALGIWGPGSMGTYLNPLAFLACAMGLLFLRGESRRRMLPFLITGVLLLAFAAFGAASQTVGTLQPNRFLAPAFLLIGLGAAYCVGEYFTRQPLPGRQTVKWIGLCGAALLSLYSAREMVREATAGPHGHYGKSPPELTAAPALVAQLESWIAANTSADGRIVFEASLGRVHGGGHVAGDIALKTGRELLGAAYPYLLPSVSFWDHVAFGRPIKEISPAQMQQGLELYNVGWVVAHSPELQQAMQALPPASEAARFDTVLTCTRAPGISRSAASTSSGSWVRKGPN